MLRCASCGELVSEFAARCPGCHHSTNDALVLEPEPHVVEEAQSDRPSEPKPEQIPEPPGRDHTKVDTRRRDPAHIRLGLIAAGAVLAAAIAGAIVVEPGGSPTRQHSDSSPLLAGAPSRSGRVVSLADDGTLIVSYPDNSHARALHVGPFQASDEPLLVDANNTIVAVRGSNLSDSVADTDDAFARALAPVARIASVDPFADRDRAVVALSGNAGPAYVSAVSLITLADRRTLSLGTANDAVGDPQGLGAFVTVAAALQPITVPPGTIKALADTAVELRQGDGRTAVLATAAQLNRYVGLDPSEPVNLTIFPTHDGSKVAIVVNPVGRGDNAAMVVLDRDGRRIGAVSSAFGPEEYTTPYWSPNNTSIAYQTFDSVGTALAVLDARFHPALQGLQTPASIGGCTWSPDSAWVLCMAASQYTDNWVLAGNTGTLTPIYSLPARGNPVAWLP